MPATQRDNVAPGLADGPTPVPSIGSVGQVFALTFEVTEALAQDPAVELDIGNGRPAGWSIDESASDRINLSYTYLYTASGNEQEGARLLTVDLLDRAGNAVDNLSAGSLVLDFTPPRIVSSTLAPLNAAVGTTVELHIELSELLPAPPAVVLVNDTGDSHSFEHLAASGTLGHSYIFTPTGQEIPGLYLAQATGADAAGNVFEEPQAAKLVLDFTAPTITSSRVVPELAAAGQRVLVELNLGEELASWGLLAATASSATMHFYDDVGSTSRRLRFEHTVVSGTDGHYQLELHDLVDLAGNTTPTVAVGEVEYDATPPALADFAQSHRSALATDTLVVSFSTTEPLGTDPVVTLAGLPMNRTGTATDRYEYELALSGTGLVGVAEIQVRLTDRVSNTALLRPGFLDVDAVPPELIDVVFTPPAARLNISAILTVSASEPLAVSPSVQWLPPRGDPGFRYLGPSGLGHIWALQVTSAVEAGIYEVVEVALRDTAGNVTVVDTSNLIAIFDVDNVRPVVSNLLINAGVFSAQGSHSEVIVSFDVSETLEGGLLEVWIGDRPMSCGSYRADSPNYTCRYTVDESEPEGLNIIAVRTVDRAGNESAASAPVRLDFTPPALVADTAELMLSPPPGCPSTHVNRWTDGAKARVLFVLDEPVGATPTVRTNSPEVIVFEHRLGAATSFAFEKTLAGEAQQQGVHTLQAVVVDQVGNNATLDLDVMPLLDVDTVAPVLSVDQSAVRYVRSPWGNATPENVAGTTVPAGPYYALAPAEPLSAQSTLPATTFVLDDGAPILLQVWADATRGSLLGSAVPNSDGTWPRLRLANLDVPAVFANGIDGACNSSTLVKLENAEWVATPAPPGYGINPHRLNVSERASRVLADDARAPALSGSESWGADGVAAFAQALPAWQARAVSAVDLPRRGNAASTYDSARGRIVLFGGVSWSGPLQDTWQWDGQSWTEVSPVNSPPARYGHTLVYDSARDRTVLFGGYSQSAILQDTWEWDGQRWTNVSPASSPPARAYHAMIYDSARRRSVLFGGYAESGLLQDTWEWDGEGWIEAMPAISPPARWSAAMAFVSTLGLAVLFGGEADSEILQDTWLWDGQNWTELTSAGNPPARREHAMVYDSARDRVVLFGGAIGFSSMRDTWEWDGQTWTDVTPASNPPPLQYQTMSYDSARARVVLIGDSLESETWEWDGLSWTDVKPVSRFLPPTRENHTLVYDAARERTVLFGGWNDIFWLELQDTWVWDGQTWTEMAPASSPPAREDHAAAYDSTRGRAVLFGGTGSSGYLQDTWEWDGQNWANVTPASSPPTRAYHAMAFDSSRGRTVLFGGNYSGTRLQDTWEWDGQTWTEMAPASS
ncbi:MAG: hypothetical protein JXR83_07425, partial [Deltaproteobacteria bacterium]|nr:hypothetical protein [Deltaproteobacteria bacterium]